MAKRDKAQSKFPAIMEILEQALFHHRRLHYFHCQMVLKMGCTLSFVIDRFE